MQRSPDTHGLTQDTGDVVWCLEAACMWFAGCSTGSYPLSYKMGDPSQRLGCHRSDWLRPPCRIVRVS